MDCAATPSYHERPEPAIGGRDGTVFLQPVNFIATVALDVSVKMIDEGLDRAGVGDVTLPANEDRKAEALGSDD